MRTESLQSETWIRSSDLLFNQCIFVYTLPTHASISPSCQICSTSCRPRSIFWVVSISFARSPVKVPQKWSKRLRALRSCELMGPTWFSNRVINHLFRWRLVCRLFKGQILFSLFVADWYFVLILPATFIYQYSPDTPYSRGFTPDTMQCPWSQSHCQIQNYGLWICICLPTHTPTLQSGLVWLNRTPGTA